MISKAFNYENIIKMENYLVRPYTKFFSLAEPDDFRSDPGPFFEQEISCPKTRVSTEINFVGIS
jgi:hypothetical protein